MPDSVVDILNPSSFDAGRVIVNVEEGGKDYSVTYLTAMMSR